MSNLSNEQKCEQTFKWLRKAAEVTDLTNALKCAETSLLRHNNLWTVTKSINMKSSTTKHHMINVKSKAVTVDCF